MEQEEEPGLGNGGLGRLAACYLDSLATLEIPAIGYGIRYEFGIFDQEIRDGWQVEITDKWLRLGNPWEIARPEIAYQVKFGGRTEPYTDEQGRYRVRWVPHRVVKGVAYDTPDPRLPRRHLQPPAALEGRGRRVLRFRRPSTTATTTGAVEDKMHSENITKVLYPNDEPIQGKHLRLQQQYFFVSCSLQDMIRIHLLRGNAPGQVPREVRRPAQRHPPGHRRGRADAPAGGRAPDGLGHGLGRHPEHLRLHQPHPAARGAGEMAGAARSASCCRGTWRSSTRSTAASSTRSAPAIPATTAAWRGMSLIDESGDAVCAHGQPGQRRQPCRQRRGRAAHRAAQADRAARLLRAVAGEVQQHDQRRHAAPLPGPQQSAPGAAHHRAASATAGSRNLDELAQAGAAGRGRGVPAAVARRSSSPNKRDLAALIEQRTGVKVDPASRSSTSRSSACTSTSGST